MITRVSESLTRLSNGWASLNVSAHDSAGVCEDLPFRFSHQQSNISVSAATALGLMVVSLNLTYMEEF